MRCTSSFSTLRSPFGHVQRGRGLTVFRGGQKQYGGDLAVFRGARDPQFGRGFADVFKAVGKFLGPLAKKALPVVLKTGKKLVKAAIQNREQGRSWGESFREAAPHAGYTALKEVAPGAEEAAAEPKQAGSGRRRHRKTRVYKRRLFDVDLSGRQMHYNF